MAPDGVQQMPQVISQAPAVERMQDVDLRQPQVQHQVATDADLEAAKVAQTRTAETDRSQQGKGVARDRGQGGGGGEQGVPGERRRAAARAASEERRPRSGVVVDVVI